MSEEEGERGSLTFFTTYRPVVKTALYSCPLFDKIDEICMSDGISYNYNGQQIPPQALKNIIYHLNSPDFRPEDVDNDRVSGLVFVSERNDGLETLYFAICLKSENAGVCPEMPQIFRFSDLYGTFDGVRMEDSGCFAGDYMIYITSKDPAPQRRQPWTAVYRTNLKTKETIRLTPEGQADLSPAVSPSGTKLALSSFELKPKGWDGEIEYQATNIFVIDIEEPHKRDLVIVGGGWPTWGSETVLYFHRLEDPSWGVFVANLSGGIPIPEAKRVTYTEFDVFTPVAIDETTVAVVTIREKSTFSDVNLRPDQYRHIEIFSVVEQTFKPITRNTRPKANHYNPFVIAGSDGVKRIGFHRRNLQSCPRGKSNIEEKLESIKSPDSDIQLYRVSGAFPSFSPDLNKLAFVDNEFKDVYVVDENGSNIIYKGDGSNTVFGPIWSQNPNKDSLYACMGPAFASSDNDSVEISVCLNVCNKSTFQWKQLTTGGFNNAFPCTNPDGTKLVFRSTRNSGQRKYKNLYIIENLDSLENGTETEARITPLTDGYWTDTHCEWSPSGEWIAFASNRDRKSDDFDHGLDTGYFAVYIVKANDPSVCVRVVGSRIDDFAGHVNHPVFSPDGRTLAVVADLAAVSCDPISLPHFNHSVRPYGDIFFVDIDPEDIEKNKDIKIFKRATHSKYENSLAAWTKFSCATSPAWEEYCRLVNDYLSLKVSEQEDGAETRHVSGHICIAGRKC